MGEQVMEGLVYELKIVAKGARGEGIGRIGDFVVFVKNAKTRVGNTYKIKLTKAYRTFGYGELDSSEGQFVGSGSLVDLSAPA
ncbi:MAG: TRAM domain-containing protein [Candidatus Marsarchaeota archaeon]|jgi:23S rRNA (uracil1939-C5)-methyltransferase|nr:TRAM domain-containing protein [Candidatus Marsarchaeota archaeon]MCL5419096.1 TRAM domain-containing protein [Candidatus Marsarchaeota archaeon]